MVFRTSPQLGPELDDVILAGGVWFDIPGAMTLISPRLGNRETGSDGHEYILVKASAEIAAAAAPGTVVIVTEPGFTAAAGAGAFNAPPATLVPIGAFFWARKTAL